MHTTSEIKSSSALAHGNCANLPVSGHGSTTKASQSRGSAHRLPLYSSPIEAKRTLPNLGFNKEKLTDQAILIFHRQLVSKWI